MTTVEPYYAAPGVTLYCARWEEILPQLAPASIDLILTDPPYFRIKEDVWDRQWKSEADYLQWMCTMFAAWQRVLKPNGSVYCFASSVMATLVEMLMSDHFHFLNRIVWLKEAGWHKKTEKEELRAFLSPWEGILFAESWGSDATAQAQAGYEEASHQLHKRVYAPIGNYIKTERERAGFTRRQVEVGLGYVSTADPTQGTALCYRWEEGSSFPTKDAYHRLQVLLNSRNGGEYLRQEYEDLRQEYEDLRRPFSLTAQDQYTDVWTFSPVQPSPGKHPCEKPLALLEHIIRVSSRPEALVLDCCAGSGSTLEAAKRLGRHAIGIEPDMQWCAAAVRRLQQEVFSFT